MNVTNAIFLTLIGAGSGFVYGGDLKSAVAGAVGAMILVYILGTIINLRKK